jgi:hypothetical protein
MKWLHLVVNFKYLMKLDYTFPFFWYDSIPQNCFFECVCAHTRTIRSLDLRSIHKIYEIFLDVCIHLFFIHFFAILIIKYGWIGSLIWILKTALMQACRYGHWEVVQTLLLFRCNVSSAKEILLFFTMKVWFWKSLDCGLFDNRLWEQIILVGGQLFTLQRWTGM